MGLLALGWCIGSLIVSMYSVWQRLVQMCRQLLALKKKKTLCSTISFKFFNFALIKVGFVTAFLKDFRKQDSGEGQLGPAVRTCVRV
jgi:hypothetical protein